MLKTVSVFFKHFGAYRGPDSNGRCRVFEGLIFCRSMNGSACKLAGPADVQGQGGGEKLEILLLLMSWVNMKGRIL